MSRVCGRAPRRSLTSFKKEPVRMTRSATQSISHQSMTLLSRLLVVPHDGENSSSPMLELLKSDVRNMSREQFDDLVGLARSNHVVVRGMEVFLTFFSPLFLSTSDMWHHPGIPCKDRWLFFPAPGTAAGAPSARQSQPGGRRIPVRRHRQTSSRRQR